MKTKKYKKVDRDTRAGYDGRLIRCPYCKNETKVYHFAWSGIECQSCKRMVDKNEWKTLA